MEALQTPHLVGKEEEAEAEEAGVVKVLMVLILPDPLLLVEVGKRRKMDFLVRSKFQSLAGRKAIQVMSLMPSDSGLGASPTTGTTMRTLI